MWGSRYIQLLVRSYGSLRANSFGDGVFNRLTCPCRNARASTVYLSEYSGQPTPPAVRKKVCTMKMMPSRMDVYRAVVARRENGEVVPSMPFGNISGAQRQGNSELFRRKTTEPSRNTRRNCEV